MAGGPKPAYHHGDLRRALIDAALTLIGERNNAELSLREVARRAGVTYAAPYHHFADKSALLAAVASEGFEKMLAGMEAAVARRRTLEAELRALAEAYLRFALDHPSHYRVMFLPEVKGAAGADALHCIADRAYEVFLERVRRAQPEVQATDHDIAAITAWSTLHGLALLAIDGTLQHMFPDPPRLLSQSCRSVVAAIFSRKPA